VAGPRMTGTCMHSSAQLKSVVLKIAAKLRFLCVASSYHSISGFSWILKDENVATEC